MVEVVVVVLVGVRVFFTALRMPIPKRQITPTATHSVGMPAR